MQENGAPIYPEHGDLCSSYFGSWHWLMQLVHWGKNHSQSRLVTPFPKAVADFHKWLIGGDLPQWASSPPQGVNNWRLWWATHAVGSSHN
jgi:hypothetical protein